MASTQAFILETEKKITKHKKVKEDLRTATNIFSDIVLDTAKLSNNSNTNTTKNVFMLEDCIKDCLKWQNLFSNRIFGLEELKKYLLQNSNIGVLDPTNLLEQYINNETTANKEIDDAFIDNFISKLKEKIKLQNNNIKTSNEVDKDISIKKEFEDLNRDTETQPELVEMKRRKKRQRSNSIIKDE